MSTKIVLQVEVEIETIDEINAAMFNNELFHQIHKAVNQAAEIEIMGVKYSAIHQISKT